jgi:TRAP-type C4-dicarboxylate transport system substrate-binding protein
MAIPIPRRAASRAAVLGAVLVAAAGPAAAAAPPKVQLKIATVAPEGSTWMRVMREIDTQVRRETAGEVGFKIYPGGVQGDEMVVLRKIRSGQLHGGGLTGQGLGQIAPAVRVLEVPFLFDDYAEIDRVRDALGTRLEGVLRDAGYTVLGWADVGFVYLFSRQPIATQQDLRRAKMWLWEGDPLAEAFFKAAGVVPVPLPVTDVLTSLQTHLVDAVYASPLACVATQWFTRVSHYTDLPVTFATGAVVVSNTAFETIPTAHRDTVHRICATQFRALQLEARKQDAESLVEIRKSGVEAVAVSAAEAERFEQIGRGVHADQAGKLYPQELLDAVLAAIGTSAGAAR